MKKTALLLAAAFLMLAACEKDPEIDPVPTPDPDPQEEGYNNQPVQDPVEGDFTYQWALDKYWADDYDGPYGLKVGAIKAISENNRMLLAGQPVYLAGINCYNLMTQDQDASDANFEKVRQTIEYMAEQKVPIVRFSVIPWSASDIGTRYVNNKAAYLEKLDKLATLCDEKHILLVPSLCWECNQIIKYTEEYSESSIAAWGNLKSKTYLFMIDMTIDLVETLKDHKSVAMWEFGNELSLQADIDVAGYPALSADAVQRALRGFAKKCIELDPHGRMVGSGHSLMRNGQYNLYKNKTWGPDSYDEYVEISDMMNPEPVMGMSEHHYLNDNRTFSDLGQQDHAGQVKYAKKCAEELGKVLYVGEFVGPACSGATMSDVEEFYNNFFNERVQLSLVWNLAYTGSPSGADFKPGEANANALFETMRAVNDKFKALSDPE